jgi:hypothetical protein
MMMLGVCQSLLRGIPVVSCRATGKVGVLWLQRSENAIVPGARRGRCNAKSSRQCVTPGPVALVAASRARELPQNVSRRLTVGVACRFIPGLNGRRHEQGDQPTLEGFRIGDLYLRYPSPADGQPAAGQRADNLAEVRSVTYQEHALAVSMIVQHFAQLPEPETWDEAFVHGDLV